VQGVAAERLTAFRIHLPLRRPFRSAHGTESVRDVILVRCRTGDDVEGWGECPTLSHPGYAGETTDVAWSALVGGGPLGPMASGAVADARLDARLRRDGVSLAQHLGAARGSSPTCHVVDLDGAMPPGGVVKVKATPSTIGRLREVREQVGSRLMAIDGNGSFDSLDQVPPWLGELGLAYVEQPFPPGREAEARALASAAGAPLALDESIGSVADLERLAVAGDVVNVKPARLGGVDAAMAVATRAREVGVRAFVGGMLETGIGRAVAVGLACRGERTWAFPTDLGPSSRYFDRDVCDPIVGGPDGVDVRAPTGPGIGRTPDPGRLAAVTVATAELPSR
jgi:O-succinylbenzoate synthase